MADAVPVDGGEGRDGADEGEPRAPERPDPEALRRRADELSGLRPEATPEENRTTAEAELMATIKMTVFGHS
jgi:hypothetical protein